MASKGEVFNLTAQREVLRSFSLSNTKTSVEQNLQCAHTHHDNLRHQWVAAEDALEMAQVLDAECESMEQIIDKEQAHRVQVAALSQMQLQAMERAEAKERELRRLSALLVVHQAFLRSLPERPHQESPWASSPQDLAWLKSEV